MKELEIYEAGLEEVAAEGDTTALRLSIQLKKSAFITTLFILSDVLEVLGKMLWCFQLNSLNLLSVNGLVQHYTAAMTTLKDDPLNAGYSSSHHATLANLEVSGDPE